MSIHDEAEGFFEQCVGKINPILVEHYYGRRMEGSADAFSILVRVMEAHMLMLYQTSIIPQDVAKRLIGAAQRLRRRQPELNPRLEDLYINFEELMKREAGVTDASYLAAARSRNDVEATMRRITLRETLFQLADTLRHLQEILSRRAEECKRYIMPGYTYRQQAQPQTMGHYLTAISTALSRDIERMIDCVKRFEKSPLGCAAFAGTRFTIDRGLTAAWLGFDGLAYHSQDGVSAADYLLEAANAAILSLHTMARFSQDITEWCVNEVDFAELPMDLIDSSSIMPQKRNPVICATIRSYAKLLAGRYAGLCAAATVEFEASRDCTVVSRDVMECIGLVDDMAHICAAIADGLIFHPQVMAEALNEGFSNATELADSLVLDGKLPFREAHKIVGAAVAELCRHRQGQDAFSHELLDSHCRKLVGRPLPLNPEEVAAAKDFSNCVERRAGCPGSASTTQVERILILQKETREDQARQIAMIRRRWQNGTAEMDTAIRQLIGAPTVNQ